MESTKEIDKAYMMFEEAAIRQVEATEIGDYKMANKNYKIIVRAARFLKEMNKMKMVSKLLDSESIGARMWAATYLLPISENEAIQVLQQIANEGRIH